MALVPHKITALAESDAQGTDGKNIVAGAVVSLYDTNGTAVTLFDDESGTNGSTAKQTDATGQVVVYVTAGEYDEEVNGSVRRRVTVGGNGVISYGTTAELQSSRPNKTGQRAENRERANAPYTLASEGYAALPGDITAANGRVWALSYDSEVDIRWLGVTVDDNTDNAANLKSAVEGVSGLGLKLTQSKGVVTSSKVVLSGLESITLDGLSIKLISGSDSGLLSFESCSGIEIKNCSFDGNSIQQSPVITEGNSELAMVRFFGVGTEGISVINNVVKDSNGAGIVVDDCNSAKVYGNSLSTCNGHGIQTAGNCDGVAISGNIVKGVDNGAGIIPMGNAKNVSVTGNIVDGVTGDAGDGITCYSDTNEYITISGNIVSNIEGHGIHCGGKFVTVSGNTLSKMTAGGIYVRSQTIFAEDITVTGNTVDNSEILVGVEFGRHGIHINQVYRYSVSGNTIENGQDSGIRLKQTAMGSVTGNTITKSTNEGIRSEISGSKNTILGNMIIDCGAQGILLDSEDQSTIAMNTIENFATADANAHGIEQTSGIINQIKDNHVRIGSGTLASNGEYMSIVSTGEMDISGNFCTNGATSYLYSVAAATSIELPAVSDFIAVIGSSSVETIDASKSKKGRIVNLQCASGVSFSDGIGNLNLNGDFATSGSSSVLTLMCVGSNWLEVSRSSN